MRFLSVVSAAVIAAAPLLSQPRTAGKTDVQEAIADVERRFEQALEKRSRPELDDVLAEGFSWIHALDGRVDSRAVFIEQSMRGLGLSRQRSQSSTFDKRMTVHANMVITTARVRNRFPDGEQETWLTQSRVYVLDGERWKIAMGQGTRMYDGPVTSSELYGRYPGTYLLPDRRVFKMDWDGDSLLATLPSGARLQVFLKSPTEEAAPGPDRLLFILDTSGRPAAVRLMHGEAEAWRAERKQ